MNDEPQQKKDHPPNLPEGAEDFLLQTEDVSETYARNILEREFSEAHFRAARLARFERHDDRALQELRSAIKLNPMHAPACIDLIDILSYKVRDHGSTDCLSEIEDAGRCLRVHTGDLYHILGKGLYIKGEYELAAQQLELSVKLQVCPDAFIHNELAWALAASGKAPEALQQMQIALELTSCGDENADFSFDYRYTRLSQAIANASRNMGSTKEADLIERHLNELYTYTYFLETRARLMKKIDSEGVRFQSRIYSSFPFTRFYDNPPWRTVFDTTGPEREAP